MHTVKACIETVIDGIAARTTNHPIDVLSVDWQHVGANRFILVCRGTSPGQEVHIRFKYTQDSYGELTFSTYALGTKPDTVIWSLDKVTKQDALLVIGALSPVS